MPRPDMPDTGATPGPEGSSLPDKKLVSWKEIATYLGREVRTVQRWEETEGLPVHRHEHLKKSTVYAYPTELDAWFKKRQPVDDPEADAAFVPKPDIADVPSDAENGEAIRSVNAPVPAYKPEPSPPSGRAERPPPKGRRVTILLAAAAILCLAGYGVYRWIFPAAGSHDRVRLVVLPFSNLSGDPKQDYISAGLTDEITTQLGRLDPRHLSVIAPTSAKLVSHEAITQIGQKLQVKYVLEGSVQSVASQIRIDVRLIETSDASYAWTQSFTRQLSDFLQVESDVSDTVGRQILAALPVPSAPKPSKAVRAGTVHASSPEVAKSRDDYLRGLFAWYSRGDWRGIDDLRSSIDSFQQAIKEDPSYAEAYAGLAAATAILGQVPNDGLPPLEAKPRAREAAQHALQLDPRLAEAHAVLGNVAMSYDWGGGLDTAEKELQRAVELNPNDSTSHEWYAHLLIVQGRNSEALAEARRALDLSPVSPLFHTVLAETHYYARDYDAAIEEAQQVVKLHPDFLLAQFWLGSAYREKKMYPQAVQTFDHARKLSGDNPAMLMAYGHAQAVAGNTQEARAALAKLEQARGTHYMPSLYLAAIHVGLGEKDEAFRLLDVALQERVDRLVYLKVEPISDPLRSDSRFAQLLGKIGLH
ncbi:MAG TPA: tetratricopeptide repeat protein [Candidatus Acidoferrum sp.]|nr:tetratricopeptide repeat protein [Candidatus Acidoferrum sp.]